MSSTGHFNRLHEAVTTHLKAALAPVPVEEHYGPFDIAELANLGKGAPIVLVSMVGPDPTAARSTGNREADKVMAAFVVTRSTKDQPAHKAANDLAERISACLHRQTFGLRFVEPARDITIDNLYSAKLRERSGAGIALMSVSWMQLIQFGIETAPLPTRTDPPAGDPAAVELEFTDADGAPQ